jgi:hypothetical protein
MPDLKLDTTQQRYNREPEVHYSIQFHEMATRVTASTPTLEKFPTSEKEVVPAIIEQSPTGETTYLDEPPAYDFTEVSSSDRKDLIIDDSRSVSSSTSDVAGAVSDSDFTRTLLIGARGIRFVRLPLPPGQLEILVADTNSNIVYTSTRAKKCSGNAVLKNAAGVEVLASEYQFGPGREPKIRFVNQAPEYETSEQMSSEKTDSEKKDVEQNDSAVITTKGKWTSRQQTFILPNGRDFTWRYIKERDAFASIDGKDRRKWHLVLEVSDANATIEDKNSKNAPKRRVAELFRNAEARTPGTSSSDAGNGGELKIDAAFCESTGLREDVIVASCLMMLKKEIDRRRAVQFMIMAGIASG